jgi:predicted porin
VTAYSAGANITAFGFTLGGEYTWGNYSGASVAGAPLANGRDASSHWALGLTYVTGAWQFGGFYGQGTQDNGPGVSDREQTVWGFGLAYTLAPGLELFGSWSQLSDENVNFSFTANGTRGTISDRDAQVLLMGTRIAF